MNELYIEVESDDPLKVPETLDGVSWLTASIGDETVRITTVAKTAEELKQFTEK